MPSENPPTSPNASNQTEPTPAKGSGDAKAGGIDAQTAGASDSDVNLDVILDVPVTISVEIGRAQIPVRKLLQYNHGSVFELDRKVGEPLDVLVNNTLIAHGEVVMIEEQFGIRLTDVISPSERIKKLK